MWARFTWMSTDKFLYWFTDKGTDEEMIFEVGSSDKYHDKMTKCVENEKSAQINGTVWSCWRKHYIDDQPLRCKAYIKRISSGKEYKVQNCRGELLDGNCYSINFQPNFYYVNCSDMDMKEFLEWFAGSGGKPTLRPSRMGLPLALLVVLLVVLLLLCFIGGVAVFLYRRNRLESVLKCEIEDHNEAAQSY